jgi:hypothetical protein
VADDSTARYGLIVLVEALSTSWDKLSSIGMAVAAVGTVGALLVGAFTFRRQTLQDRRAHASRISIWMEEPGPDQRAGHPCGLLCNSSDEPAYRCQISFFDHHTGSRLETSQEIVDVLPPWDRLRVETERIDWARQDLVDPAVEFTDRAGRRWERDRLGRLTDLGAEDR